MAPPTSSAASTHSQGDDDDALASRLHLPPHALVSADCAYEGETPNVLADTLWLRPPAPSRTSSWHSILGIPPSSTSHHAAHHHHPPEPEPRAPSHTHAPDIDTDTCNDSDNDNEPSTHRRSSHSRSKSRVRKLAWWQRPSPIWFFPGTFILAMSAGMILAPKIEIYTQLICRAMPVDKSHVSLPPPVLDAGAGGGWGENPTDGAPIAVPSAPGNATATTAAHGTPGDRILFEWTAAAPSSNDEDPSPTAQYAPPAKDGDSWSLQCQKSSAVQAAVAQLALVLALMMGVLSSLTTGWWGAFSDRRGRKPVLLLALCGTVMMDSVFLLTVHYHHILSYNFLFLGPFLDGIVGGWATAQAAVSAYISDCTSPGSRARVFSLLGGCLMGGFALGPLLGSFLISSTGGWVLAPFYVALAAHCAFVVALAVALPESLSRERQLAARERHEADRRAQGEKDKADDALSAGGAAARARRALSRAAARPFAFLKPLGMLLPRAKRSAAADGAGAGVCAGAEDDPELRTNIEWGAGLEEYWHPEEVWRGKAGAGASGARTGGAVGGGDTAGRRDWALTKIATAYACNMALMGVMTVKLLYARTEFGWAPTTTGYFLSYMGFMRLLTLLVVLPLGIRLLRRRPIPTPLRPRPAHGTTSSNPDAEQKAWDAEARWLKIVADSHFDLSLARLSLSLDLVGFLLFLVAPLLGAPRASPAHELLFLLAVAVQSLGSGTSPAIQSLALAHATPRDAGRLFASLSVVQAVAAQVVSPVLFTAVFSRTVGRFDEAIFALAVALSAASLAALGTVRLRRVYVPPGGAARASADGGAAATEEGLGAATTPPYSVTPGAAGAASRKSKSALVPQRGFGEARDDEGARGRARERRGSWSGVGAEPYRD